MLGLAAFGEIRQLARALGVQGVGGLVVIGLDPGLQTEDVQVEGDAARKRDLVDLAVPALVFLDVLDWSFARWLPWR
ncbi:MAG: hypothetical protein ACLFU0_07405 [Alphaproteobacteria bacterium]